MASSTTKVRDKLQETDAGKRRFKWDGAVKSVTKATATLEPEPTQHNSLDRLQIRKYKSKTLLFMSAATLKPIRLECYLRRLSGVSV
jgi:hypothetical protein